MIRNKIIFSAPFGNYLSAPYVTSTIGTFTLAKRAGFWRRWWRVIKTVRYSWTLRAWVNKLGLPSPGIEHALDLERLSRLFGKIVSLHGFSQDDWYRLLSRALVLGTSPYNRVDCAIEALELNFSCPNVKHAELDYKNICMHAQQQMSFPVIVKLPPINWRNIFFASHCAGIRHFHCCNTLPHDRGGISGKLLKPISLDVIRQIKAFDSSVAIIGGGGITSLEDINDYRDAGAKHYAIGSGLFNPMTIWRMKKIAKQISTDPNY